MKNNLMIFSAALFGLNLMSTPIMADSFKKGEETLDLNATQAAETQGYLEPDVLDFMEDGEDGVTHLSYTVYSCGYYSCDLSGYCCNLCDCYYSYEYGGGYGWGYGHGGHDHDHGHGEHGGHGGHH